MNLVQLRDIDGRRRVGIVEGGRLALLDGVELTERELLKVLEKHGVKKYEPQKGDKFDPNLHQAMYELPDPSQPAGTVAQAVQPGYMIGERMLRPALVGVAKGPERDAGRETFFAPGREPIKLKPRDPVLYFVQRLRDEAHRFAIGTHRAKRSKAIGANPLDEIAGIGPTRKSGLMQHFGSAKGVSRASVEDLKAVSGISAEMAQKIYDFFHERGE
mgnify:CR=1 FL=1